MLQYCANNTSYKRLYLFILYISKYASIPRFSQRYSCGNSSLKIPALQIPRSRQYGKAYDKKTSLATLSNTRCAC